VALSTDEFLTIEDLDTSVDESLEESSDKRIDWRRELSDGPDTATF
jgi:hypothetical protein